MLANAIAWTAGGILLIDEVETAIHAQYYNDIFRFLVVNIHLRPAVPSGGQDFI